MPRFAPQYATLRGWPLIIQRGRGRARHSFAGVPYKAAPLYGIWRVSLMRRGKNEVVTPLPAARLCVVISFSAGGRRPMTADEFRKLALSFPETEERAHRNHPDFRVAGKIFATLGYPNTERGMVKVTPVEQEMLVRAEPSVFSPETGAWGRQGCTRVELKTAKKTTM